MEKENEIVFENKIPDKLIIEKRYILYPNTNKTSLNLIRPSTRYEVNRVPKILTGSCVDYLDIFYNFVNDFCDEINVIFISDLKDITLFHYME